MIVIDPFSILQNYPDTPNQLEELIVPNNSNNNQSIIPIEAQTTQSLSHQMIINVDNNLHLLSPIDPTMRSSSQNQLTSEEIDLQRILEILSEDLYIDPLIEYEPPSHFTW